MPKNEEIKNVLNALFQGIVADNQKEVKEQCGDSIQQLLSAYGERIKDMKNFDLYINNDVENVLESVVQALNPNVPKDNWYKVLFIYTNFGFIERNIREYITKREGFSCCADKSNWLIRAYKEYLVTGTLPDMTIGEKCFWKPHFGTGQQWVDLCDGLIHFHYGKPEQYFQAVLQLTR